MVNDKREQRLERTRAYCCFNLVHLRKILRQRTYSVYVLFHSDDGSNCENLLFCIGILREGKRFRQEGCRERKKECSADL